MKFQTSCSLHLVLSQPADVSGGVTRLIECPGDQGVHDPVIASETVNNAVEGCLPGDRFTEITLRLDPLELQLEIATSSPQGLNGKVSLASGTGFPREEILAPGFWSHRGQALDRIRKDSRPFLVALPELRDFHDLQESEDWINFMANATTIPIL